MKTYTATLVTKQYQTVRVTVPDNYTPEQIEIAICENASLCDGEFENDVFDIEEVTQPEQEPERYTTYGMQVREAIRQALATQGGTE